METQKEVAARMGSVVPADANVAWATAEELWCMEEDCGGFAHAAGAHGPGKWMTLREVFDVERAGGPAMGDTENNCTGCGHNVIVVAFKRHLEWQGGHPGLDAEVSQ